MINESIHQVQILHY